MANDELLTMISAFLEICLHELVYAMNVYPLDSFVKTTFLGIVLQINRHVDVVDYISNVASIAVPVLLNGGDMIVLIGDETFQLSLRVDEIHALYRLDFIESRFRDFILCLLSMGRRKEQQETFQVQLRSVDTCQELINGISNGQWYQISAPSKNDDRVFRPIFNFQSMECEINLYAESLISKKIETANAIVE
jgi:hypothetical protein